MHQVFDVFAKRRVKKINEVKKYTIFGLNVKLIGANGSNYSLWARSLVSSYGGMAINILELISMCLCEFGKTM